MSILGTAVRGQQKTRRKKQDELLSSVVRETAVPAAVQLLKENSRFTFPSGTAWVVLVLDTQSIGGLNRRQSRNEAKGSIIGLIEADQIATLATAEMLQEEVFGIIPNGATLARMEEYSLLNKDAAYGWASVWQQPDGSLVIEDAGEATFEDARAVGYGRKTLQDVVSEAAWNEHSGLSERNGWAGTLGDFFPPTGQQGHLDEDAGDEIFDQIDREQTDQPEAGQQVFAPTGVDEADQFDEIEFDGEPVFAPGTQAEVEFDDHTGGLEEFDADEPVETYDDDPEAREQDADGDDERMLVPDQAAAYQQLARRFLAEELDLQVPLAEFNATFGMDDPVVQIEIPEGASEWLGDQVNQLGRQANADLVQLRGKHRDQLRTLYVNLMGAHAANVIKAVAVDREGSKYQAVKSEIEKANRARQDKKLDEIQARRSEIFRDFEAQANKVGQQAAIHAEVQYKERNRPKMERAQADAVAEVERGIEDAYVLGVQQLLGVRRQDADLKMEVGMSRIFEVLGERQSEYLAAEHEVMEKWTSQIQRIVEDNRKADISRTETLLEQQRTSDEVGLLRREQEAALENLRSEHNDRVRRLEEELARSEETAVAKLRAQETEWLHSLDFERQRTETESSRNVELRQQLADLEPKIKSQYEDRLAEVTRDKEAYAKDMDRAAQVQARSNSILMVMIVSLSLLMLVAGFIGGVAMG